MNTETRFKFLFLIFVLIVMVTVCAATALFARPSGGPAGMICNSCHGNPESDAALSISGIPAGYTPGQKYSITIGISGSAGNGPFGFQVWTHTPGGKQAGTLTPGAGSGFNPGSPVNGVVYVGHTSPGCAGSVFCSWTVSWTAPPESTGTVQIDAQGVQSFSLYAQKSVTFDPAAAPPPPAPPQFAASNPISPNTGSTSGGTGVTINGSDFVTGAVVSFGSTAASTTFVSSTQLTAVSPPAAAAGAVTLKVQNPDGQSATLPGAFTYTQATALAPQFAASNPISPNSGSTSGGTGVTLNGSNFVTGAVVSFGSATASTTFVSSTQLTAVSPPAAAAGAVTLKVQNPDGQSATLPGAFTYTQATTPAPQFAASNAISPNTGSTSGGTGVTINGSNFVTGAVVSFGSATASTTFVSSTQLTAVSPPAATAGAVTLKVQNPDGQSATFPGGFTYTQTSTPAAPQFAASNPVFPTSGSLAGGMMVTLNGSNFVTGAVAFFGATPASTQFISAVQLMAVAPPATVPGAISIKIQNPDGQSATLPGAFAYTQTPAAPPQFAATNASAPHIGPMTGGTEVAIKGSNFLSGAVVYFGAISATRTQFISPTQLLATSPVFNNAGSVGLQVLNPDGQTATLPASFTYYDDSLKVAYAVGGVVSSKSNEESVVLSAPAGGGIFTFSHNGTLVTTVGTAAATPTTSMLMFVDSKPLQSIQGELLNNTGVAILNGSTSAANLTFTLLHADGTPAAPPVSFPLFPGNHLQGFITDSNFFGSQAFNFTGTLKVDSNVPISALTLQQTTNQAPRYESLLTSTPVADLTKSASNKNLVFAQLPAGGGFQTRIVLLNTTNSAISGRIVFYKDNSGASKSEDIDSDSGAEEVPYSIPSHGGFSMLTDGSGPLQVGFAMVVPDPANASPLGTGMFVFTQGAFTVTTTGVPSSPVTNAGLIYANTNRTSNGLAQNTGVALVNPSATQAIDLVFKLRDLSGNVVATQSFSQLKGTLLRAHGHLALFVNELFGSAANNFTGTMSIETTAPEGVSALTLLQTTNERNESLFTTLPVAINASSSVPLFFPQLVCGGGYETQLVLLNPTNLNFSGAINFYSGFEWNNGMPVAMPLNDSINNFFQYSIPPNGGATFK
ncbi:MAG: IPT/TIG domain-containing protein [Terriglobia bacterium]